MNSNVLSLPRLTLEHPLNRILRAKHEARDNNVSLYEVHWNADFWGLNLVLVFEKLGAEKKSKIVSLLSHSLIQEAYFIEKGAMLMMSKFAVEAKFAEERALFSIFAAEEAKHFLALKPFYIDSEQAGELNGFLSEMAKISSEASPRCAIYILQVILDGWGLWHYKALAAATTNECLKKIFEEIIHDEASHHGAGVMIGRHNENEFLHLPLQREISGYLKNLLRMIRIGPVRVFTALSSEVPSLSYEEIKGILIQLNSKEVVVSQLEIIARLIGQGPVPKIFIDSIQDLLVAPSVDEMASALEFLFQNKSSAVE